MGTPVSDRLQSTGGRRAVMPPCTRRAVKVASAPMVESGQGPPETTQRAVRAVATRFSFASPHKGIRTPVFDDEAAGAAILALGATMLVSVLVDVPEAVTGMIGALLIGAALWSSWRAKQGENREENNV